MKHEYTGIEIEAILEDTFGPGQWTKFIQLLMWTASKSGHDKALGGVIDDFITFLVVKQAKDSARLKKADKIEESDKVITEFLEQLGAL